MFDDDDAAKRIDALMERRRTLEREVARAREALTAGHRHRGDTRYCSFCGKSQHAVAKLIAGPGVISICNECVALCMDICRKDKAVRRRR